MPLSSRTPPGLQGQHRDRTHICIYMPHNHNRFRLALPRATFPLQKCGGVLPNSQPACVTLRATLLPVSTVWLLCIHVGTHCSWVCVRVYVCVCVCICGCVCVPVSEGCTVRVYVCVCMRACVYVWMCMCVYLWMCVCVLVLHWDTHTKIPRVTVRDIKKETGSDRASLRVCFCARREVSVRVCVCGHGQHPVSGTERYMLCNLVFQLQVVHSHTALCLVMFLSTPTPRGF